MTSYERTKKYYECFFDAGNVETEEIKERHGTTECTENPPGLVLGQQEIEYGDENIDEI
jgi:hypothetical protein